MIPPRERVTLIRRTPRRHRTKDGRRGNTPAAREDYEAKPRLSVKRSLAGVALAQHLASRPTRHPTDTSKPGTVIERYATNEKGPRPGIAGVVCWN